MKFNTKAKLSKDGNTYTFEYDDKTIVFRYREINDYNLNALLKNEIWTTTPIAFNDPYDTSFTYDKAKFKRHIVKRLKENKKFFISQKNNYKVSNIEKLAECIAKNDYDNIVKLYKRTYSIACFSMDVCNETMWAHYTGSGKGFALEYNLEDLMNLGKEYDKNNRHFMKKNNFLGINDETLDLPLKDVILPVVYKKYKYDATSFLIKGLDNNIEMFYSDKSNFDINSYVDTNIETIKEKNELFQNAISLKRPCWKYEKEVRLIANNMNPLMLSNNAHSMIGNLKPKAIYMGEFIEEPYFKLITQFAKENNIQTYKMYSKTTKDDIKLAYKKIC